MSINVFKAGKAPLSPGIKIIKSYSAKQKLDGFENHFGFLYRSKNCSFFNESSEPPGSRKWLGEWSVGLRKT